MLPSLTGSYLITLYRNNRLNALFQIFRVGGWELEYQLSVFVSALTFFVHRFYVFMMSLYFILLFF